MTCKSVPPWCSTAVAGSSRTPTPTCGSHSKTLTSALGPATTAAPSVSTVSPSNECGSTAATPRIGASGHVDALLTPRYSPCTGRSATRVNQGERREQHYPDWCLRLGLRVLCGDGGVLRSAGHRCR